MSFEAALSTHFANALPAEEFVKDSYEALRSHGFEALNTIACVSVCRDELTYPLIENIRHIWGEAFNFSSLAGMLYLGKTGFTAAHHHAPNEDGHERYVYFALPHIGIDAAGQIGNCQRSGRKETSHACGALVSFQQELTSGSLRLELDPDDLEQSFLKPRLLRKLTYGQVPSLVDLTKIAQTTILEDLERMINYTVDTTRNHYAVLTGIQIHGPEEKTFVCPSVMYVVVNGKRQELALS